MDAKGADYMEIYNFKMTLQSHVKIPTPCS